MDAAFPSSNWLGIPDLDVGLAADCVPLPVRAWGSTARTTEHAGTWHGYVDDVRFGRLLKDPTTLTETGCAAAVEPNVSVYDDTPLAVALAGVYRKRWCARVWQAAGVRVFADVNVPARLLERPEWAFGLPPGWPAYATRGYDRRAASLDDEYAAARAVWLAGDEPRPPLVFLVVGGGRAVAAWCAGRPGVFHSGYQATKLAHSRGATA
jgi:hypothetical protein